MPHHHGRARYYYSSRHNERAYYRNELEDGDPSYRKTLRGHQHQADTPATVASEKAGRTPANTIKAVDRLDSNCSTFPSELSESSADEGQRGASVLSYESPETTGHTHSLQEHSSLTSTSARIDKLEAAICRMQDSIDRSRQDSACPDASVTVTNELNARLLQLERNVVDTLKDATATVISEVTEDLQDFTYKLAQNQIDLMSEMLRQTLAQAVAIVSSNTPHPPLGSEEPALRKSSLPCERLGGIIPPKGPPPAPPSPPMNRSYPTTSPAPQFPSICLPPRVGSGFSPAAPRIRVGKPMPGDSPRMASSSSEARRLVGIINATSLKSALVNNNHTGIVASTSNTSGTGKSSVTWEYTRDEQARCGGLTREDIRDFFNCGIAGCASVNSFNVVIDCDILAEAGVNYSSHVFDIISILEAFIAAKKTGEYFDVARQWGYVLRNITAGISRVADPLDNHL